VLHLTTPGVATVSPGSDLVATATSYSYDGPAQLSPVTLAAVSATATSYGYDGPANNSQSRVEPPALSPMTASRTTSSGSATPWRSELTQHAVSAAEDATSISARAVRFTQDSAGNTFKDGRSVEQLANDPASGKVDPGSIAPIRVFSKDGDLYSLDNRRLFAGQYGNVNLPFSWATPAEIAARNQTQVLGGTGDHDSWTGMVVGSMTTRDGTAGRDVVIATNEEMLTEFRGGNDWENPTLDRYLEAFAALLGSIDNHYVNTGQPVPQDPWVIVAEVFRGAKYYE
jgi:hypothetical protein